MNKDAEKVAKVIGNMLGIHDTSKKTPDEIVQLALAKANTEDINPSLKVTFMKMIELAKSVGINTNPTLKRQNINYHLHEDVEETLDKLESDDESLDDMVDDLEDEDVIELYGDDEISLVGDDLEESVDPLLTEVLSRTERMRARFRFLQSKGKRLRKLQIALHKRSDSKTLAKRARHLAIIMLKKKLSKKANLADLTVSEKEKLERIISKKKKLIDRLAMRLLPKLRKLEEKRLKGAPEATHE